MFERMRAAIGEAAEIALQRALPQESIARMRAFLRPLELLVRQTVFIEAAAIARAGYAPPPRLVQIKTLPENVFSRLAAPPRAPQKAKPALRLWPKPAPPPVRIRQLGPALLVRDLYRERAREILADRLNMVRFMRPPEPLLISRRIEALMRILAKPLCAARRLARKLKFAPFIACKLATRRAVARGYADEDAMSLAAKLAYQAGRAFDSS